MLKKDNEINCFECEHYFVTRDKFNPRGCKEYNFKSKYIPSQMVLRETGVNCLAFKQKK